MLYALELLFNEKATEYVKGLLDELHKSNIISLDKGVDELCPHITLGIFHNLDEDESLFIEKLKIFKSSFKNISTSFEGIGSFPLTGTLLLNPRVTEDLLSLHKKFYEDFKEFRPLSNPYYLPDKWSPHCTLVTGVSNEELKEVFNFLVDIFTPIEVSLNDIGLFRANLVNDKIDKSIRIF